MTIAEAEEYISDNFEDINEFILEDDEDRAIVNKLCDAGYTVEDVICSSIKDDCNYRNL